MPLTISRQAQQAIAKAINQRGYGPGELTTEQYIFKQFVIAMQEVIEVALLYNLPSKGMPAEIKALLKPDVHQKLKEWFHDVEYFKRVELPYSNRPFLDDEIADAVIPWLNAAEQGLVIDLMALCLYKAENDIKRGVTR